MEQVDQRERVFCFDPRTGDRLWEYDYPARHFHLLGGLGPRSTPSIAGDRVVTLGACGVVACLELASGNVLWQMDLHEHLGINQTEFEEAVTWGCSGSPLIIEGMVVVPLGGKPSSGVGSLVGLHLGHGKPVWRAGDDQISYSSPSLITLQNRPQIVYLSETEVAGYDVASGKTLWRHPWPGKSNGDANVAQPIDVGRDRLLLTKAYGAGCELIEIGTDQVQSLWKNAALLKTKFCTGVCHNGHIYALSDGILECVDVESGKRRWKKGRYGHGQLLLVGDRILLTSESGELILLEANPKESVELGKLSVLDGTCWNTFAVVDHQVWMRSTKEMACVQLPVPQAR
jgi:outer membrane protein assembly factor BamB